MNPPQRRCEHCGEVWPPLTGHVCPPQPVEAPAALSALLSECWPSVWLGDLDIGPHTAAAIIPGLAMNLSVRLSDLEGAIREARGE